MPNPFRSAEICVLGSANVDSVHRVGRIPRAGETVYASSRQRFCGGKGLNQAVAAARMGASVVFCGAVGDDADGRAVRETLVAEGIGIEGLRIVDAPTGTALVTVDESGENSIVIDGGANDRFLELRDVERRAIAGAEWLVLQAEVPLPLLEHAMAWAFQHGTRVVFTPAPVRPFPSSLLERVDVLVPNEHEALLMTGASDAEQAARVLSQRGSTVIVTLGARGAVIAEHEEIVAYVAPVAAAAVDTTAAGDTFVGAFCALRVAGLAVPKAAAAASAAAAITVGRPGASESMPRLDEVQDLLSTVNG